eukprot:3586265-Pyramimonas_sp.AAC.2
MGLSWHGNRFGFAGGRGARPGDGGGRGPGAVPAPRGVHPPAPPPGGQLRPGLHADVRRSAAQHRRPQGPMGAAPRRHRAAPRQRYASHTAHTAHFDWR